VSVGPAMLAAGAATMVRLLAATTRIAVAGTEPLVPLWTARRPLIYAVWHGRILMMPWVNAWLRRRQGARRVAVLASRSRDGEFGARYVRRFGLDVVRGSSSRGGAGAAIAIVAVVRAGEDVVVVPDGPRGPRQQLQAGIVALASLTGAPVVPMAFAARPARRLATWDEFLVPLPFARCAVVFGEPIALSSDADRDRAGKELEQALNDVTAAADRRVSA